MIDIAQDLLLADLHRQGLFEHLVFKGGTCTARSTGKNSMDSVTEWTTTAAARIHYATPFGGVGNLTTKLDIGPAPWLAPEERSWIRLPIHNAYTLPTTIPVMALEENMAEKIARLTRRTPARDVYDLVWIATTSPYSGFDRAVVRHLPSAAIAMKRAPTRLALPSARM